MCLISYRPENSLERAPQTEGLTRRLFGSATRCFTGHAVALPLVITMLSLGLAQQVKSQSSPLAAGAAITVQYGYLTHHYLTAWEDDNLPAGVLRGLPPHSALRQDPGSESLAAPPQTDDTSTLPGLSERQAGSYERGESGPDRSGDALRWRLSKVCLRDPIERLVRAHPPFSRHFL
ncbi:MAG: hypothetical protein EBY45_13185 [Gammaproteobacteria bacterium]|nr:hypothetical protein [Gammaproteobacteria bacterium]